MKHHLVRWAMAPIALAALISAPTRAAVDAPAKAPPVNVEACKTCHGPVGVSLSPAIPNLAGQKAAYLENQLKAFKAKERKNDLMAAIAGQLSEADIHELALYWSSLPAAPVDAHGGVATGPAIPSKMAFPAGFPAGYTLYVTDTNPDGSFSERYANAAAVGAARAGKPLPEGSVILVVNRAAAKDAAGKSIPGAITSYTGMESRAGWGAAIPTLLRNENWDYALFTAEKARRDSLNQAQCLACHKPMAADSYVFTMKALKATAAKG